MANNNIFSSILQRFFWLLLANIYGRMDRIEVNPPSILPTSLPPPVYNICLGRSKKCFQMVPTNVEPSRRLFLFYITMTFKEARV